MTPAARRAVVTVAREAHGISERRACSIIGADRSALRYRHRRADDAATRTRLKQLAAERRRFGWRRLKLLLEREGIRMNHKKLRRLYGEERLQVPRRGGRKRALGTRAPIVLSPKFPPLRSRVLGCRHAHRDGVSLFGRAAFLRPGRLRQRGRAQPGSSLAAGHRQSRRAAGLTQASTAAA